MPTMLTTVIGLILHMPSRWLRVINCISRLTLEEISFQFRSSSLIFFHFPSNVSMIIGVTSRRINGGIVVSTFLPINKSAVQFQFRTLIYDWSSSYIEI